MNDVRMLYALLGWEPLICILRQIIKDTTLIITSFAIHTPLFNFVAIAISSGDFPHISGHCTDSFPQVSPECPGTHAPILVFGSVFQSSEIFSNMMAMPMPNGENLHCFKDFALGQRKRGCQVLQRAYSDILYDNGQRGGYEVFGEELGLEWQVRS